MFEAESQGNQHIAGQTVHDSPYFMAIDPTDPTEAYRSWHSAYITIPSAQADNIHKTLQVPEPTQQQPNPQLVYGTNPIICNIMDYSTWCWNLLNMSKVTTNQKIEDVKIEPTVKVECQPETTILPHCSTIAKVQAIDTTVKSQEEGEQQQEMKVNKRYKTYEKAIVDTYNSRQDVIGGSFDLLYRNEVEIYKKAIVARNDGVKSVNVAMNRVRCNLTKYVRGTLKCMAKACAELFPEAYDDAVQLFNDLSSCTRVDHFSNTIHSGSRQTFLRFFRVFVDPGHLFVQMLRRMNYTPVVSILMLEALLVFRKMVKQPTTYFGSWKVDKLDIVGNYTEPIQRLQQGNADFQYVRSWVDKEYKKCKSKFKKTKCSGVNNVTHFLCQITQQMLIEIYQHLRQCNEERRDLEKVLLENINQLKLRHNEETLLQVTQHPFIKQQVNTRFLGTNRLLVMILEIRSNALMIKHLIDRYSSFANIFKS